MSYPANESDDLYEQNIFYNRKEEVEPGYVQFKYVRLWTKTGHRTKCFVNVLGGRENFLKLLKIWNCTPDWHYTELS